LRGRMDFLEKNLEVVLPVNLDIDVINKCTVD
jgi:hypothetical protein